MDRIAIMEINEVGTKMLILETKMGRYNIVKQNEDSFTVGMEIDDDQLLKPKTVSKIVSTLTTYREFAENYNCQKIIGVAANILLRARNQKGFFEELYNNTGVQFSPMTEDELIKSLFSAYNGSIDVSRGFGIHVGGYSTEFFKYNRRTIIDSFTIPYGMFNISCEDLTREDRIKKVSEAIKNTATFGIDANESAVVSGDAFINFGRVAKKVSHYPIDIDNNYEISKKVATETFKFINNLDLEKVKKVKNIYGKPNEFLGGIHLIEAIYSSLKIDSAIVADTNVVDGVIFSYLKGESQEKFTDLLGVSCDNLYEFRKNDFSNNVRVCNMAAILFKQLKVMHKLPRAYVKPMRIAAYLYDIGKSVNFINHEKYALYAILNSGLKGATQKDLLLAGFIALCQNPDNFSLSEWMKYKDIVTDEDLDAVRKLGVIVKLASALNSSKKAIVMDIVCDILGDSIIMKTIVNGDPTYDILQGMKVAVDYRKVYKKNLQII